MMNLGRYIGVIMMLAIFLTANALQYTHDITHSHNCETAHHEEHQHPFPEECTLCWFVFHQIGPSFIFDVLLPDVAVQERFNTLHGVYHLSCEEGVRRSLGNKDPPLSV